MPSGMCTPTNVSDEAQEPPRQEFVYAAAKMAARAGYINTDGVIDPEAISEALQRVIEAQRSDSD